MHVHCIGILLSEALSSTVYQQLSPYNITLKASEHHLHAKTISIAISCHINLFQIPDLLYTFV